MGTTSEKREVQGVAIVGVAGRFPGAASVAEFWKNICDGVESITSSTDKELTAAGVTPERYLAADYVRAGGYIENADLFDASFFGFNAREAEIVDPQHRIFLECCWDAFEDAAYDPFRIAGAVGVFAGAGMNTYGIANLFGNEALLDVAGEYQLMVGNDKDFLATRVAYKLNLRGPAISVQTACSTSLVAVQMAFESLQRGECDMALAGGVSVHFPQNNGYQYVPGMILSPDGHCRAFDAKAAGTVPGRGSGVVLLKRLDDAIADRDHIYAVIRGAAINNDGATKVGYSAPSVEGQSRVIARSMQMARFDPDTVRYIEAHGTGTEIGDPVEVKALSDAFGASGGNKQFCALGSVKTNIGHLDTAAGVTGLIKVALAVRNRLIPPTLHYQNANPLISFDRSPFYVSTSLLRYEADEPFRAGVSSFGIGGTNAHVSIEEYPAPQASSDNRPQLLLFSARSEDTLAQRCHSVAQYLIHHPNVPLQDVAWTLQDGRHSFRYRKAIIANSAAQAGELLANLASSSIRSGVAESQRKEVLFMFSGQGSQYANMGRGLYRSIPVFRDAVDTCCEFLQPVLHLDLRTLLYPEPESESAADVQLAETWLTQPALFVVEYATAQLCMGCGIQPTALLGHSVGEFVAACLADVFSLKDALHLIALRGKLIYSLPPGSMSAVSLPESQVIPLLSAGISIAAVNATSQTVVSGPTDSIAAFEELMIKRGVEAKRLRTSHAFHSSMLDPIVDTFSEQVAKVQRNAPSTRILSNLTGTWLTDAEATSPGYWARHLRHTVRFADCAAVVAQQEDWVVLEVGPGETLLALLRQTGNVPSAQTRIHCIRQPRALHDDYEVWLTALSRMWIAGSEIKWSTMHEPHMPHRLPLPSYPFDRQRYWINPVTANTSAIKTEHRSLDKQLDTANWFYTPTWLKSSPVLPPPAPPLPHGSVYLVLADGDSELSQKLTRSLTQVAPTVLITTSESFQHPSANHFTLSPHIREHWHLLLSALTDRGQWPERIVHTLTLQFSTEEAFSSNLDQGFFSLMALTQAIGNISSTRNVHLSIVTSKSLSVAGESIANATGASLCGFAKVVSVERLNTCCSVIDVDSTQDASSFDGLIRELTASPHNDVVALRHTTRWTQSFDAVRMNFPAVSSLNPTQSGAYLITGGLGGLGLIFAEELARSNSGAHFILTSRTAVPPEEEWESILTDGTRSLSEMQRVRGLLQIKAAGGKVTTVQADASDAARMNEIVSWCNQEFSGVRGVIHAAGIPAYSMIQMKTREEAMRVFQSKLHGTLWIEKLLSESRPDFILLCSSISSVVPTPGLSDYATANAYLDAFAAKHDSLRGTRVISANWDTWSGVGMAVDVAQKWGVVDMGEAGILHAITPKEGAAVLGRVLSFPSSQVVVSTRDLGLLLEHIGNQSAETETPAPDRNNAANLHPRPNLSQSYVEPADEMESDVSAIWGDLLGVDRVGRHDNFFELGGHSLLGTQVMARIRQRFGLDLPLRTIFEASTPAEMANFLRTIPWASGISKDAPTLDGEREEIEL